MKATSKKASKKPKVKAGAASPLDKLKKTIDAQAREIREGAEQQVATREILRLIATAPDNLPAVLTEVAQRAARLCDATDAQIFRRENDLIHRVASFGDLPTALEHTPYNRQTPIGRAMIERQIVHIPDLSAVVDSEFPVIKTVQQFIRHRTTLAVPLLRDGFSIGAILIRRLEVRPFTDTQIKLLETFADQAVIAIENARLFQDRETRNRDLSALHDVTAAASQSLEIKPVLDEVVKKITEIFNFDSVTIFLYDPTRETLNRMATFGIADEQSGPRAFRRGQGLTGRVAETGEPILFENVKTDPRYQELSLTRATQRGDFCFFGIFPIKAKEKFVGTINCLGKLPRKLTRDEIRLINSMCDQIGVAVENINLFEEVKNKTTELESSNAELREALDQQTATSEILRVIASSPTNVQPVLDAVVENAARLCDANDAQIGLVEGDVFNMVTRLVPTSLERTRPITRNRVSGRAFLDRKTVHITDLQQQLLEFPESQMGDRRDFVVRTVLATPLLREGTPVGIIMIRRTEVRPFSENQIALIKTFADQAVIAIENVRLFQELQARNRDLTEALEQQTATSEVLQVISRSTFDLQPVLETLIENATKLCGARSGTILRHEGESLRLAVSYNLSPELKNFLEQNPIRPGRETVTGRVALERRTVHIPDVSADSEYRFAEFQRLGGVRAVLGVPMLREGTLIGVIVIRRTDERPFTDKQIGLVTTFADQAVIAIENVRLFQELQARNRDLTEALEQQTATSEILRVIASSPTDVQPVLDVVAENAARLCNALDAQIWRVEGDRVQFAAQYGSIPSARIEEGRPIIRGVAGGRAILDRETIHIPDAFSPEVQTEFPESWVLSHESGVRTLLATPLLREGTAVGYILIRRLEAQPFSDKQIALLKTFADQAVIAIENVRLFQELKESLEQQTATSEILGVIASSPTEIQPVLDVVAATAARLCDAVDAQIRLVEGDGTKLVSSYGTRPAPEFLPTGMKNPAGRAILQKSTIHVHDLAEASKTEYPEAAPFQERTGSRTFLSAPMLRGGNPIGLINIRRTEVRPFAEKQIKLLETFAAQAVIAIENVRLFQELQERTNELARSVGELKALGEVGQAVSSTLDLPTVLNTIVGHAVQLSGTSGGIIYEYDDSTQVFDLRASYQMEDEVIEAIKATPVRLGEGATGRAATTRTPVEIPDIPEEREYSGARARPMLVRLGYRSLLAVPLLREQQIMGALTVWRRTSGSFSPEVVNILRTFATQSALAIQNARLFREIEDKGRQLEAANRHKSEFLANVSHELRTPLNAVIGFSEVLQERLFGELNEKQAEYTDDILSSGRHLLSLINDILDLSKIEAGRMELELTTFYLPDALENALLLVRERASRHGIKLDRVIDDRVGDLTGDERKVKQVLVNLLSNAVKFTPEGGQIKVEATLGDSAVIISVTDTGIGIAPQDQEAIFEEFRQVGTNYAQKREGTGLGLSLTRKFIELHGGKIWVESEMGKGSKFTFTLPVG